MEAGKSGLPGLSYTGPIFLAPVPFLCATGKVFAFFEVLRGCNISNWHFDIAYIALHHWSMIFFFKPCFKLPGGMLGMTGVGDWGSESVGKPTMWKLLHWTGHRNDGRSSLWVRTPGSALCDSNEYADKKSRYAVIGRHKTSHMSEPHFAGGRERGTEENRKLLM